MKNIIILNTEIQSCTSLLGSPYIEGTPAYFLSLIFSMIKYVAILLLIVLTTMDFINAVASQDNDILKKSFNKALKRMILCIILFFTPTIVNIVLEFINDTNIANCINVNM